MKKILLILLISLFLIPVFFVDAAYITGTPATSREYCEAARGTWNGGSSETACSCPANTYPSGGICDCISNIYVYNSTTKSCELPETSSTLYGDSYLKTTTQTSQYTSIKCVGKDVTTCDSNGENCVTSSNYGGTVSPVEVSGSWYCPAGYESDMLSTLGSSGSSGTGGSGSSSSGSSGGSSTSSVTSGASGISWISNYITGNSGGKTSIPMPTLSSTGTLANPISSGSFADLISRIIDWVLNIALILAPLVVVYGGFIYMTAVGDTNKVSQGKNIILYAVIGFIVALLAKSLIGIFTGLVVK